MTTKTTEKPKSRLSNLNELIILNEDDNKLPGKTAPQPVATTDIPNTVFLFP